MNEGRNSTGYHHEKRTWTNKQRNDLFFLFFVAVIFFDKRKTPFLSSPFLPLYCLRERINQGILDLGVHAGRGRA